MENEIKCKSNCEVKVLKSDNGFYIGARDSYGPYCKLSDYYNTRELAEEALQKLKFKILNCRECI